MAPGLVPASFSETALEKMARRKTKVPNWYLDVSLIRKYWEGTPRAYHHTCPINMYYGLHQVLDNLLTEGLGAAFARHQAMHERLRPCCFNLYRKTGMAPQVNLFMPPAGVDKAALRACVRTTRLKLPAVWGLWSEKQCALV